MTPYEQQLQKKRAAILSQQMNPLSEFNPNIVTPRGTAEGEFDPTASQNSIDYQRELAAKMLTDNAPQGRMVGNIFVPPNALEGLGAVAKAFAGGYALNKANKRDAVLEEKKALKASALARQASADKADKAIKADNLARDKGLAAQAKMAENDLNRNQKLQLAMAAEQGRNARASMKANAGPTPAQVKAEERAKVTDDNAIKKEARFYSKDLSQSGLPAAQSNVAELDSILNQFKDDKGNITSLPGVGGIQNYALGQPLTLAGDIYDSAMGNNQGKPKGADVQRVVKKLMNTDLTEFGGKAQTAQEVLNQRFGTGFNIFADDKTLADGIGAIKEAIAKRRANIDKGYSDEARALYDSRVNTGVPTTNVDSAAQEQSGTQTNDVGTIVEHGGKRYRIIGGDPNDPDVEEVL